MERAYEKFIEVGKIQGLFSIDDPVQPKIVVVSPVHVTDRTVSRFLVADEDGKRSQIKKNQLYKINEEEAAKIDGSLH